MTNSTALEISDSSPYLRTIKRNADLKCINKTIDKVAGIISYTFGDGSILHFPLHMREQEKFKVTAGPGKQEIPDDLNIMAK